MRWSYGLGESAFTLQHTTPSPDLTHSPAAITITVRGTQSIGRPPLWDLRGG
ncbi:hypothetical protein Afe04nite_30620 [Asanoa ferruginea]|nr:hypothetical protein Afe04nite_30620 [Asanoa ferruginea]